jgi:hypothetical protein
MGQTVYWFKREKVTVLLPAGSNVGVRKWRRLPTLNDLRGPEGTRQPHRLVIGLEFYKPGEECSLPESRLEGTAEIRVRWNPEDVDHVGGDYSKLQLYYFYKNKWTCFDNVDLRPDGNDHFGWGITQIQEWKDPPIAWDA